MLHLLGCETGSLGHDYYCGSVEVGENINVHAEKRRTAGHENQRRKYKHGEAVVERKMYYFVEHLPGLLF